jgi:hypothetical protein
MKKKTTYSAFCLLDAASSIKVSDIEKSFPLKFILMVDAVDFRALGAYESEGACELNGVLEELRVIVLGVAAILLFRRQDDDLPSGDPLEFRRHSCQILHVLKCVTARNVIERFIGKRESLSEPFTPPDRDILVFRPLLRTPQSFRTDVNAGDFKSPLRQPDGQCTDACAHFKNGACSAEGPKDQFRVRLFNAVIVSMLPRLVVGLFPLVLCQQLVFFSPFDIEPASVLPEQCATGEKTLIDRAQDIPKRIR